MRIDWLKIPTYRNLKAFEIDLDENVPTTVLLGRNGTGKSNLIEALVEIFRGLELDDVPGFSYQLQYQCGNHTIRIDADPARAKSRLEIAVDGKPMTKAAFMREAAVLMPRFVFAYYSGWSTRLERHFDRPTRRHYEAILRSHDQTMPMRRLFFCRKDYSQLVLLAFFLDGNPTAQDLLTRLRIRSFESALFVLKTPWWKSSGAPTRSQVTDGDPRFWYARGAFKGFLGRLWRQSLAPLRNTEAIERDVRRQGETTERLYLYIKDEQALAGLRAPGEDSKTLFSYLESLFLCDLIDEVRVTVERLDGTRIKFTQMSEGEQQLLTVLGLLLFTQDDESLYLLDEPDTHLNPVWTYDFLKLLQANIRAEKGQLLIATHNPLMIGSLRKNQVRVFARDEAENTTAVEPDEDPFAMGVDGLLMSEFYGMATVLPDEATEKINERNQLFAMHQRTATEDARLRSLSEELAQLGILRSYLDPYEQAFVQAMARRQRRMQGGLSPAEIQQRNDDADLILEELFAEGETS